MPLSRDNLIEANDISRVIELKELKVYVLIGREDDKIVIKHDAVEEPAVKNANTIVKGIDPSVKLKILTPNEVIALTRYVAAWEALNAHWEREHVPNWDLEGRTAIPGLKASLAIKDVPWVKMAALDIKDLDKAVEKRLEGDKSAVNVFIAALSAKGGLEKLGQVIAADLFNGNTDRFLPDSPRELKVGQGASATTFSLKCLQNIGNVFVAMGTKGYEVSALDFVDPQSRFRDIHAPLGENWKFEILRDKKKREAFAAAAIADLETLLHPHKSPLSPLTKLGKDAPARLATGMVQGAAAIKARLEKKFAPMPTDGVGQRYTIVTQVK